MKSRLPFDELNAFESRLKRHFNAAGHIRSRQDCEDIIDELLDLYLLFYADGVKETNRELHSDIEFSSQDVESVVYERIDGATWRDRVLAWYASGGTIDDIMRIADTEAHRIGNEAAYNTAVRAGATNKTWVTMLDDRVRDTHQYLHGVTVPIYGYFYSSAGGQTQYPGQWGIPEEDCNCRCWLTFS